MFRTPTNLLHGITVSNMSQQLKRQFFNNWQVNPSSSTIDKYRISQKFYNIFSSLFKVIPQVYFTYNYMAEISILVLKNTSAGKFSNLVGEFQNLSTKFFGGLNSKISIDSHLSNELLRLSWKFEATTLKNIRNNSVYNFFWSIVEELTCQLLAYVLVGLSKQRTRHSVIELGNKVIDFE